MSKSNKAGWLHLVALVCTTLMAMLVLTGCGDSTSPTSAPAATGIVSTTVAATTSPAKTTTAASLPTVTSAATPAVATPDQPTTTVSTSSTTIAMAPVIRSDLMSSLRNLPPNSSYYIKVPNMPPFMKNADEPFPAAALIDLWIAGAFFDVDNADLNQKEYQVKQADIVPGTGILAKNVGKKYGLYDLVDIMLTYSDNSAANIVIKQLGGFDKVNVFMQKYGYKNTKLERYLGTTVAGKENVTTARDVARILYSIDGQNNGLDGQAEIGLFQFLQGRSKNPDDTNFFGKDLPKGVDYVQLSGVASHLRNVVGTTGVIDNNPIILVAILSNQLDDEAATENAIADVVNTAYQLGNH